MTKYKLKHLKKLVGCLRNIFEVTVKQNKTDSIIYFSPDCEGGVLSETFPGTALW